MKRKKKEERKKKKKEKNSEKKKKEREKKPSDRGYQYVLFSYSMYLISVLYIVSM